ncbi:TIR domain-containing protein [Gimibacter soli]|uniref:TIR domain-containing protein n=1 Tax=Gimibacter soli TaxID=3024400 RepID=A0AAE9XNX4_9PROT|nr:TIR domain-containing protein [Gimibacter soli]WCL53636.1 TIR domain-containing protein [Gimibacter soli]
MGKQRAFVSFDYENDEPAKVMFVGQSKHLESPFEFKDNSVRSHLDGDWEQKVRRRMENVDVVVILCGRKTHTADGVSAELEIARAAGKPYFLLAAYGDGKCTKPKSATSNDKLYRWTWDNLKALFAGKR